MKIHKLADVELPRISTQNEYLLNSGLVEAPSTDNLARADSMNVDTFLPNIHFRGKGLLYKTYQKVRKLNKETPTTPPSFDEIYKNNEIQSLKAIRNGAFDIFHPTYYDPYFLEALENKPFVITVFDMIHELFPEYFPPNDTVRMNKIATIRKARKVIAISEQTKIDLTAILDIDPNSVEVVYLAGSLTKMNRIDVPSKYLLFVGNRTLYKNFLFATTAIAKLMKSDPELYWVCCGGGDFAEPEISFLESLGIYSRVLHLNPTDQQLAYLYKKAKGFVYPTLYEGFGLPLLEAFTNLCPVAASNIGSTREIAQDTVEYFDPKSIQSIVTAIEKVLYDTKTRKRLIKKGTLRVKDFSWEKTARKTIEVYKSAM